jgi:anti-sigma factor ChrR (cupin superfamily)
MNSHDYPESSAELASLYAAGALTPEERESFEAHLATGCAACHAEVSRLSVVTAQLFAAVAPLEPAPEIRAALLSRIAAQPSSIVIQRASEAPWQDTPIPGVRIRILSLDRALNRCTILARMEPGRAIPGHHHTSPEESLVLEGDLRCGDRVLRAGDFQRAEAGSTHEAQHTEEGCLVLLISSITDVFPQGGRSA